jgi:hypothetical protein
MEERWEAIEQCERLFHDARKRVSTDNIGLAKLGEGLELVRIGEPKRPEFAACRYGDQFGRRRRRAIMLGVGAGVVGTGVVVAGIGAGIIGGGGWGMYQGATALFELARKKRRLAVVLGPNGERLTVQGEHADKTRIIPVTNGGWSLDLHYKGGQVSLEGEHARRATALIMPKVNAGGAARVKVQEAVNRIEASGDGERYLKAVSRLPSPVMPRVELPKWGNKRRFAKAPPPAGLTKYPLETRLAVEMAVNEENERRALEGELALLELEWKEAEEIAGIADRLGAESVDEQFDELRSRVKNPG